MFKLLFVPLQSNLCAKLRKMIETLLISTLIIAIGMAFFCVKLIFRKDGRFSSQHIHDSKAMKERGIHCVMDQDREMRNQKRLDIKH